MALNVTQSDIDDVEAAIDAELKSSRNAEELAREEKPMGLRERVEALLRGAADPEDSAELVQLSTLKSMLDQSAVSLEEACGLVDAMIAEEGAEAPTTEDEKADEELESARLDSLQSFCMQIMGSVSGVLSLAREMSCPPPSPMVMEEEVKAAVGKRNSSKDLETIQRVHDHSVLLGAACAKSRAAEVADPITDPTTVTDPVTDPTPITDPVVDPVIDTKSEEPAAVLAEAPNAEVAAPADAQSCGCENNKEKEPMTAEQKAEAIKTLMACKHSGFSPDDQTMLETASDARIESFLVAAEARRQDAEKVREPKALTTEEFLKIAPPELKALVNRQQRQDTEQKAALVSSLKAAQEEYSETELSAMPIESLERLARMSRVKVDYSGRGVVRAATEDVYRNPPDSYALALAARRKSA